MRHYLATQQDVCVKDLAAFLAKGFEENDSGLAVHRSTEKTRPLACQNVTKKIVASALNHVISAELSSRVTGEQQDFLKGRSTVSCILAVDACMKASALLAFQKGLTLNNGPVAVFFDFKAAFPSVSQDYLFTVLQHFGAPDDWRRFIGRFTKYHSATSAMGHPAKPVLHTG